MADIRKSYTTKKCYECLNHLPLDATRCSYCKKKVGGVNAQGIAEKPVDWKAYLICLVAFAIFFGFVWKFLL